MNNFWGRFPRVTKIRNDKTWAEATSLDELKVLFKKSKENTDVSLLLNQYKTQVDESDNAPATTSVDKWKKRKNHDNGETSLKCKKLRKENGGTRVKSMDRTNSMGVQLKNPLPDLFKGIVALFATSEPTQAERYFN